MQAVVYDAIGATPEVRTVPAPVCPADGVVVAVGATGVCRSDWHAWRGHDPVSLPHIPGHELAGTIDQIGPLVTRFVPGDRVTTPFVNGCGVCDVCAADNPQVCPDQTQPGFSHPGSFADLVALRAADVNLVRLPEDLPFVDAAALGCRFGTAYRALTAHGRLMPGQAVAIFGCGGLGLSAILIAKALGGSVVAVDRSPAALRQAAACGADVVINPDDGDPIDRVRDATGGGAHVAMDALGSTITATASLKSLRRRGRHLQVGLLLGPEASAGLPMDRVISYELELYGSHGLAAHEYPAMFALIDRGPIPLHQLVGRVITLADAPAALMAMDAAPTAAGITVISWGA